MTIPRASVVVPAHDEADSIEATLRSLLQSARPGEFEVVVVCNGCTDDTAAVAARVVGVAVHEIPEASKVAALRHGDAVATAHPRVYLDADVQVTTDALRAVVGAFADPGVRVAGLRGRLDVRGASRAVRWYFDFRERLPVFRGGVIGAGIYALDERARRRLGSWPEVLGDDQYVLRSFSAAERVVVEGHRTVVGVPADLRALVRRQLRVRRGNRQLTAGGGSHSPLAPPRTGVAAALLSVVGHPSAWPGLVTWVLVNSVVRVLDRLPVSGDWGRPGTAP